VASLVKAEREGQLRERIRFLARAALLVVDEDWLPAGHSRRRRHCRRHSSPRPAAAPRRVVIQIEGSSYRLRQHADLVPEHVRSKATITSPLAPKRRGRPGKSFVRPTPAGAPNRGEDY
jgi:hypothetical protein